MPAIFGIIGKGPSEERLVQLHQMLAAVKHNPDYQTGMYANDQQRVWVGWTAHRGSFVDPMPVWNETKDVLLVFSGEDFTDSAEIELLSSRGHDIKTEDAGYLVHFYEEMGSDFIKKLNGWFSGLLLDFRRELILLFNDRYGLGRVYYHEDDDGFYFSSEAKALLHVMPKLREMAPDCLAETFSYGCVMGNRTLFPKISLLPGGSKWSFNRSHIPEKGRYFSPLDWETQPLLDPRDYYEQLKETFARILPRYFRGDKAIAMSLTGGLDGRMIMAWAKRPPGTLPCYTFGSPYRDCADVKIAQRIAKLCGQPHETISLGQPFFSDFPSLAEKAVFISDGTMDVSGSVELYVNKMASQLGPVRLTGNYGSEIVRRNVAFRPGHPQEALLNPDFAELVRKARTIYANERQGHTLSFIAFKQVPWHHYARLSLEQSQLTLRTPYLDNDLVSLIYRAPVNLAEDADLSLRLVADGNHGLSSIPTDRGLRYKRFPLTSEVAQAYQEFTYKAEYAYDYGMPKWLATIDHFLAPFQLERIFLGLQKFYHFRVWYRDQLSGYVRDVLLDPRSLLRPYLNRRRTEEIVTAHISGRSNYTLEIHRLLSAELTQRLLLEML